MARSLDASIVYGQGGVAGEKICEKTRFRALICAGALPLYRWRTHAKRKTRISRRARRGGRREPAEKRDSTADKTRGRGGQGPCPPPANQFAGATLSCAVLAFSVLPRCSPCLRGGPGFGSRGWGLVSCRFVSFRGYLRKERQGNGDKGMAAEAQAK